MHCQLSDTLHLCTTRNCGQWLPEFSLRLSLWNRLHDCLSSRMHRQIKFPYRPKLPLHDKICLSFYRQSFYLYRDFPKIYSGLHRNQALFLYACNLLHQGFQAVHSQTIPSRTPCRYNYLSRHKFHLLKKLRVYQNTFHNCRNPL